MHKSQEAELRGREDELAALIEYGKWFWASCSQRSKEKLPEAPAGFTWWKRYNSFQAMAAANAQRHAWN